MRLIQVALFVLLIVLQYRFWFAENGYTDLKRIEKSIAQAEFDRAVIQKKNAHLEAKVADLKSGSGAIEELARQNLGLIKPGETFIMINEPRTFK
ncbi:septum formation initiator family protein [Reinekea marina]|uniref:Cell division protein FtsB n=1 Tax=Reinekea marina TaxID=1310421 RepID=A0ABV7WQC2_9GAMM|nr:septum formation initiator family protein [Reinekea marina]MBU2863737.1 septum formation initiator family protein [Reinekea forsetii]MDN3650336.1 septum formation initiator family protein [Reinekea marina]MDN3651161.1 septum formation initiator family protein [Reinekea marina]